MKRAFVIVPLLLLIVVTAGAQSIWDQAHLARVREHLGDGTYAAAYRQLLKEADACMEQAPLSVMMKEKTAR